MSQIVAAQTSAGFTLPAGSSLNVSGSGIVHITPPGQNLREIVLNGAAQMVGPYRFDAYIGLNATATAALSYDVTIGYGTVGDPVTVPSISQVGLTVTATLAIGWIATGGWQWKRVAPNGTITDISGATSASYTQQAADLVAGTRIYPQPIGLTFAPYGITADGTIVVTPGAGTLALSASTYSVGEAAGSVAIVVNRSGGSTGTVTGQVATSPGTAVSPADFTATTQTVTLADGVLTATVNVPIVNDTAVEGNETFNVTLTSTTLGSPSTAVVTIVDDDTAATAPGAPTIGTATAGNATASVPFTAPGSNGGSAILDYRITASTGQVVTGVSTSPGTVTGMTNGTAVTFTVAARNAVGYSLESAASNSVTPVAPADTRPRFAYGPANAIGDQSIFDSFTGTATPLTGSANGGKTGTFQTAAGTNYTWIFIPATADASGLRVFDDTGYGGFSGAASTALNPSDPNDPITTRQNLTIAGVAYHGYRSNGKAANFSGGNKYTTS